MTRAEVKRVVTNKLFNASLELEEEMQTLKIQVPVKRLAGVFGHAYPKLSLQPNVMSMALDRLLMDKFSRKYGAHRERFTVEVDFVEGKFWDRFDVMVRSSSRHLAYMVMEDIEAYIKSFPIRPLLSGPYFWQIFRKQVPGDIFHISHLSQSEIFDWILENLEAKDYQIYNRFGGDLTLGFKKPDQGVMFKIAFGDKEL